jgi:hypothetical protein
MHADHPEKSVAPSGSLVLGPKGRTAGGPESCEEGLAAWGGWLKRPRTARMLNCCEWRSQQEQIST